MIIYKWLCLLPGRSEIPSKQAFEGGKFYYSSKLFLVKGFWHQIFNSRECYTANSTASNLSNTCVLLLINKIYITESKPVVNRVTLRPKEMIHMFVN